MDWAEAYLQLPESNTSDPQTPPRFVYQSTRGAHTRQQKSDHESAKTGGLSLAPGSSDPYNIIITHPNEQLDHRPHGTRPTSFLNDFWSQKSEGRPKSEEFLCCISSPKRRLEKNVVPQTPRPPSPPSENHGRRTPVKIMPFDFICGVVENGSFCRRKIDCSAHFVHDKLRVNRSKPLKAILMEHKQDPAIFERGYKLALDRIYKPQARAPLGQKKATQLNRTGFGVMTHDLSTLIVKQVSPRLINYEPSLVSESSASSTSHSQSSGNTKKLQYIKQLSQETNTRVKETVAYLHYRLKDYHSRTLHSRVAELDERLELFLTNIYSI